MYVDVFQFQIRPFLSILMTSTPSVPQYMPSICQNIDISRHVLVYRYIHFWTNGSQVEQYFGTGGVYACLFTKCFILVRVDVTHQSSTTTSSTPSNPNFSALSQGADTKQGLVVLDNSPDCGPGRRSSCSVGAVCGPHINQNLAPPAQPLRFKLLNLKAKEQHEIYDRATRMVENTTIRSYRCMCDSQMQRPGVIILLFKEKQTRV